MFVADAWRVHIFVEASEGYILGQYILLKIYNELQIFTCSHVFMVLHKDLETFSG